MIRGLSQMRRPFVTMTFTVILGNGKAGSESPLLQPVH